MWLPFFRSLPSCKILPRISTIPRNFFWPDPWCLCVSYENTSVIHWQRAPGTVPRGGTGGLTIDRARKLRVRWIGKSSVPLRGTVPGILGNLVVDAGIGAHQQDTRDRKEKFACSRAVFAIQTPFPP